ncbi:MAG: hypothetical protein A2Y57_02860 [Candidatus Woykebacteria bacterium RBG_13_40_7b]|uniref:Glycerol-3-phosphate acyltransferase n=1 Tax=Candidatus Woykebacteria bacterium RBG_13_40_7b TaxID=1802594 RepID=A0A1G1W590_9BACT|nr:MAG: hypothetical protein A2Y57_02860 [Candidatus Woykebacteria bacterium RBG_13_40_7b]
MTNYLLISFSYFLGSIPFSKIFAGKRGFDITKIGSKNPGATNVWKNVGWGEGLTVLILDISKGVIPVSISNLVGAEKNIILIVGFAAVFGHCFSPFLKFYGGNGISTSMGIFAYVIPKEFFIVLPIGLTLYYIFKLQELGVFVGTILTLYFLYFFHEPLSYFQFFIAIMILFGLTGLRKLYVQGKIKL